MMALNNNRRYIAQHLSVNGQGTGTVNANGDYSSTATRFKIKPGPKEVFHIKQLIVAVYDETAALQGDYGNLSALTNGYSFTINDADGNTLTDLSPSLSVKVNADLARLCCSYSITDDSTNSLVVAQWNFTIGFGEEGLIINGELGEDFGATFNDNLSGLTAHYFAVRGIRHRKLG